MKKKLNVKETKSIFIVFSDDIIETAHGDFERIPLVEYVFETEDEAINFVTYNNKRLGLPNTYYYEEYSISKIEE
jgi:hypothetical protein